MAPEEESGIRQPELLQTLPSQVSSLTLEDGTAVRSPTRGEGETPTSVELPSLALPLSRTRSSTTAGTRTPLRAAPSISVDDDNASVRSFVPTLVSGGEDLEAMLGE